MNDEQSHTKLTEFRNWLIARLEARQDSPAMWYRFMKLKEALEHALGQASAEGQGMTAHPPNPKGRSCDWSPSATILIFHRL
jgi:hypothetical protein